MPVALERKLKRQVAGKKISKERKDAYVYGTLRKTGWKPEREKKMNDPSKLVRLSSISSGLDSIIKFAYDDDDENKSPLLKTGEAAGATAGVGVGGTLLHQAIKRQGGYRAALQAGKGAFKGVTETTGQALLPGMGIAKGVGSSIGSVLGKAWKPVAGVAKRFLESKEKPIRMDTTILEPFQGSAFKSKIAEEQFPSGLSPAAALRLPFPQLMSLLKSKNILQQVFSEKLDKLISLNGKLDEINLAVRVHPSHLKQHFPTKTVLAGTAIAAGAGVAGIGAYKMAENLSKQREWTKNAGDRDLLRLPMFKKSKSSKHDLYIDKHGAMYPVNHPRLQRSKITEI